MLEKINLLADGQLKKFYKFFEDFIILLQQLRKYLLNKLSISSSSVGTREIRWGNKKGIRKLNLLSDVEKNTIFYALEQLKILKLSGIWWNKIFMLSSEIYIH